MPLESGSYGKELIMDLHNCDVTTMEKHRIERFLPELCARLDMVCMDKHWWTEEEGDDHLVGNTVVQFIRTSNITIHALTKMRRVYINVFSCKDFCAETAAKFIETWFNGSVESISVVVRV